MKCHEFEQRLNELLDERAPLDLDNVLSQHHQHCSGCQKLLRAYQDMLAAVRLCEPPRPNGAATGEEFTRRVVAQAFARGEVGAGAAVVANKTVSDDAQPSRRGPLSRNRRRWALAATAAAVFLAVSFRPRPASDPPERVAVDAAQPAIGDLARDATDRYFDLRGKPAPACPT